MRHSEVLPGFFLLPQNSSSWPVANGIMANPNLFTLAAENSPRLLILLRSQPDLASSQDAHGYSLVHAAASYNHLDLLRTLVTELYVDVNIKDEDGESALFVVETVEAAQVLCEELHADPSIRNAEGNTAEEKIQLEGDYTTIADYLKESRIRGPSGDVPQTAHTNGNRHPPPLPPNVRMQLGTLEDEESLGEVADPTLRQRIAELAAREDFEGEEGQQQLRQLIADSLRGVSGEERDVRTRLE